MRAVVALVLAVGAAAQTTPGRATPPPVRIDAVAFDAGGRFVETLTRDDFEVFEGDTERPVTSVRLVRADGALEPDETVQPIDSAAAEQFQAARDGTRLFAIFLDEYHVTAGDGAARARDRLTTFVDRTLGPRDLVMLVKPLDSLLSLRMTRDREAVRRAIAGFEGRKGDYAPRSALEKSIFAGNAERIQAVRVQVVVSALNAIATHLGGLSTARKAMIVVSEGFPRPQRRRGDAPLPTLEGVVRSANRATVSIYPIDPRALAGSDLDARPRPTPVEHRDLTPDRETLAALADDTDGRAILTPADLAAGIDRLVRDTSLHYLLTLTGADDGTFHPVEVRVRRPDVRTRARKGYWAATPDDLFRAARAAEPSPPPPLPRRASPLIRPWFGLARGSGGNTSVSFVWEPTGRVPGERARAAMPARIVLKALQSDGTTVYEGVARPSGPAMGPPDTPAQLVFSAPPGRLRVQMSIEDAAARVLDTDVRDVIVGPLAGQVSLGTPRVLRSRTARDHRALETNLDAVPAASREFSRIERLLIRVPVYAAGGQPQMSGRLLSGLGGAMRDLAVAPTSSADLYQIDLPLAGLAAGEYAVEIVATGSGAEARESVTFRVTP
jgi:VWFA-related protein